MAMTFRTIEVVVGEEDGRTTIFSAEGYRITTVPSDSVASLPDKTVCEWREWAESAANNFGFGLVRLKETSSPWMKRINAMCWSWKCRKKSIAENRKTWKPALQGGETWLDATRGMMRAMSRRRDEYRKRTYQPWFGWATTAANNNNRRGRQHRDETGRHGNSEGSPRPIREARIQVCDNGMGVDSTDGIN